MEMGQGEIYRGKGERIKRESESQKIGDAFRIARDEKIERAFRRRVQGTSMHS